VIGYIPATSNYLEFYGLNWLFNFNSLYSNLYSLDPALVGTSGSTNDLMNYSPNLQNFETHVSVPIISVFTNGQKQLTVTVPAFLFSDLSIKFNFDPVNSTFDANSFTSSPTGLFVGGWEFSKIEDVRLYQQ